MIVNEALQIWEFDVDNTLIHWDLSAYPDAPRVYPIGAHGPVEMVPNQKNVNLLVQLAKSNWYIVVHSGSGAQWAKSAVQALDIEKYVDEVRAKPRGRTDDRAPGDGLAYTTYREPA
jgi:hydroxymethylpyrimidine pyrophosphatase-like HAD family hydrolase